MIPPARPVDSRRGEDHGFTVVELSIVMAISLIVMSSLLSLLVIQSNASARMEKFVGNQEQARLAFVALQRDLRSAEGLLPGPANADAASQVELLVYASPTATAPTNVRWRITSADFLVREVVTGATAQTTFSLAGVANRSTGVPLLSYYGPSSEVPYAANGAGPTIASCAVRIGIELLAAPLSGPAPARLSSDVQLRNRILEEGRTC